MSFWFFCKDIVSLLLTCVFKYPLLHFPLTSLYTIRMMSLYNLRLVILMITFSLVYLEIKKNNRYRLFSVIPWLAFRNQDDGLIHKVYRYRDEFNDSTWKDLRFPYVLISTVKTRLFYSSFIILCSLKEQDTSGKGELKFLLKLCNATNIYIWLVILLKDSYIHYKSHSI